MSDLVQNGVPHLVLVIHLHQVLRQRDFAFRMVALAKANLGAIKAERPLRRKPVQLHQVVGQFVERVLVPWRVDRGEAESCSFCLPAKYTDCAR